jgi:nucleoside-diphosphate-sugar epimerase
MTAGTQQRDWIYVEDVAAGFASLLGAQLPPGTTVELGTGQLTSVADVVRQIYALTNRGGQPKIGVLPGRPGEERGQVADAGRTKELVGWETAVSLSTGLTRLINQFTP